MKTLHYSLPLHIRTNISISDVIQSPISFLSVRLNEIAYIQLFAIVPRFLLSLFSIDWFFAFLLTILQILRKCFLPVRVQNLRQMSFPFILYCINLIIIIMHFAISRASSHLLISTRRTICMPTGNRPIYPITYSDVILAVGGLALSFLTRLPTSSSGDLKSVLLWTIQVLIYILYTYMHMHVHVHMHKIR